MIMVLLERERLPRVPGSARRRLSRVRSIAVHERGHLCTSSSRGHRRGAEHDPRPARAPERVDRPAGGARGRVVRPRRAPGPRDGDGYIAVWLTKPMAMAGPRPRRGCWARTRGRPAASRAAGAVRPTTGPGRPSCGGRSASMYWRVPAGGSAWSRWPRIRSRCARFWAHWPVPVLPRRSTLAAPPARFALLIAVASSSPRGSPGSDCAGSAHSGPSGSEGPDPRGAEPVARNAGVRVSGVRVS
jgi:hypothetical protein